jgi:hypothetical protein
MMCCGFSYPPVAGPYILRPVIGFLLPPVSSFRCLYRGNVNLRYSTLVELR